MSILVRFSMNLRSTNTDAYHVIFYLTEVAFVFLRYSVLVEEIINPADLTRIAAYSVSTIWLYMHRPWCSLQYRKLVHLLFSLLGTRVNHQFAVLTLFKVYKNILYKHSFIAVKWFYMHRPWCPLQSRNHSLLSILLRTRVNSLTVSILFLINGMYKSFKHNGNSVSTIWFDMHRPWCSLQSGKLVHLLFSLLGTRVNHQFAVLTLFYACRN